MSYALNISISISVHVLEYLVPVYREVPIISPHVRACVIVDVCLGYTYVL